MGLHLNVPPRAERIATPDGWVSHIWHRFFLDVQRITNASSDSEISSLFVDDILTENQTIESELLAFNNSTQETAINTSHRLTTSGNPHKVTATEIDLDVLNSATAKTIQEWLNHSQAAGYFEGGGFTDNGDGSVSVSAGSGIIKVSDTYNEDSIFFEWDADTNVSLADNSTNYIYVVYDPTTPTIASATTEPSDIRTNILLGKVYREGSDIHSFKAGMYVPELGKNVLLRFTAQFGEISRVSGGVVSETGTLNVATTNAVVWGGLSRLTTTGYDTSDAGSTFEYYYYNFTTSAWVKSDESAIDADYYNDITTGTGLVAITSNQYGAHWVYIDVNGNILIVYGQDSYTLDSAQAAQPPSDLPERITDFCWFAAKIIVKESTTVFTEIQSAYDISFSASSSSNHNELNALQGGQSDQYYHLTSAEHTIATQAADTSNSGYLTTTDWDTFNDKAGAGANSDITSMTGLSNDGIPAAKVKNCLLQSLAVADLNDSSTPSVLTTAETTNTIISNYKSTGADHVFTMPAAHAAGNVIFVIGDEFQVDIEPNTGDLFYLNGTAMAANEHIQNTADTLGETITGVCANINGTLRWMFYSSFDNFVEETP